MYLRYTLPPGDLYEWYEDYLQDEEEIDVKAGGGQTITMGQMVYQFMTKLDWYSTLFPRVPVPIQKQIQSKIENYCKIHRVSFQQFSNPRPQPGQYAAGRSGGGTAAGSAAATGEYSRSEPTSTYSNEQLDYRDRETDRRDYDYERPVEKYESRHRSERNRSKSRSPSPSRERKHKHKKHKKHKSRDRSRSRERHEAEGSDRHKHRDRDYKRH